MDLGLGGTADVAVVGGGPGGYVAALRAADRGANVVLVERDGVGGVCLHAGCIPSKALLSATGLARRAGDAGRMGVHADPEVRPDELGAWRDRVVRRLALGVENLLDDAGVTVVDGTATFETADHLRVAGADGESATLEADAVVVACGSRPVELPGAPFGERVCDAGRALELDPVPDRLVVVGAGYVGMELAAVYAALGTEVVVAEALEEVLPGFPADLAAPVRERATARGVDVRLEHRVTGLDPGRDGVAVALEGPDGEETVRGDRALVAVGREPAPGRVDPRGAGLELTADGALATDDRQETPVEDVYAVGDVAGEPLLAHAAMREGRVAAAAATGGDPLPPPRAVPAVAYTDPEVARVGATPAEVGAEGQVGEFPFSASGRALTAGEREGFARVVADADGTVVGGGAVGHGATEVVAELGLAVETGATLADLARTVHAHPTMAEATFEAALDALGEGVHGRR